MSANIPLSSYCVGLLLLDMDSLSSVVNISNETPLEKNIFLLPASFNFSNFLIHVKNLCLCPRNTVTQSVLNLCTPCVCCYNLGRFISALVLLYLENCFLKSFICPGSYNLLCLKFSQK